jgi:carboxyl-terminal processing protease
LGAGYVLGKRQAVGAGKADLTTFWKAWQIIDERFFGDATVEKRTDGAIAGMVGGLGDPYTVYLAPKQDKAFREDLQGSFGGIGAELSVKSGQLVIVSSLDGTPAAQAGLRANDVITEIDGKKTSSLAFADAIDMIRGEKGSELTLTIFRPTEEKPLTIKLIRDIIVVKSVTTDSLLLDKSIAYIKVNQFGQDTADQFRTALQAAGDTAKRGVIIDLRNNPGGYLTAAMAMIGMVIPKDGVWTEQPLKDRVGVIERGKDGEENLKMGSDVILAKTPIVVLVNEGSASASEIFSGAMKDYARAKVIGVKTFGKGSVQELQELGNGGSIKVTVAKWFTPLGTGIDGKGVEPDITVALPDNTPTSKEDIQVQKALELLK